MAARIVNGTQKFQIPISLPKPGIIIPEMSPEIQVQGVGYLLTA